MINAAELATTFEALLNNNSLGLKYRLFYYIQDLDRRYEKVDGVNEQFIPAMIISTTGRYRPLPNANISDSDFIFNIFFPQKYKDDVLLTVDEFALSIVGKKITSDGQTILCNMEIPIPQQVNPQNLRELNELDNRLSLDETQMYGVLQIKIFYMTTSTYLVGNDVIYSLKKKSDAKYTVLTRTEQTLQIGKSITSEQFLGGDTSLSIAQSNMVTDQVTFYLDMNIALLKSIVEDIENGTNQNQVYTLKKEYSNLLTITKDVIIRDGACVSPLGNVATLTLTFAKAWNEL